MGFSYFAKVLFALLVLGTAAKGRRVRDGLMLEAVQLLRSVCITKKEMKADISGKKAWLGLALNSNHSKDQDT